MKQTGGAGASPPQIRVAPDRWFPQGAAGFLLALLSSLCLARPLSAAEIQFGGAVTLPFTTNIIESILVPQWRQGAVNWIRTSSALLASHGFDQVAIVSWAPETSRTEGGINLPDDLLGLYWHCRTNLPVYPDIRQAWEIWNEPDFYFVRENPDRMAAVLKAAYWGIKAGNSNATVLMPSVAFTPDKYLRELLRNNAFEFTEGYNFHFYGWAQDFLRCIRQHEQFQRDHGLDLPLWITEAGYFQMLETEADDDAELARQQAFHERLAISARAAGIRVYLPFILTPYTEAGYDLGLVTDALDPRPALTSYLALTRLLPKLKPLFQIWHAPTGKEIGVVFRENEAIWRTSLWTPHRWKDVVLPTGSATSNAAAAANPQPSTALALTLRFTAVNQLVHVGLNGPGERIKAREIHAEVSAETNLHIRTSAVPFEISDCEWRPIPDIESNVAARQAEASHREPSPVILQMNYDRQITADKPSQTYRFDPRTPVRGRLSLYNLSDAPQQGRWSLQVPPGWTARVMPRPGFTGISKQLPEGHRRRQAGCVEGQIDLPPVSKTDVSLVLIPPEPLRLATSWSPINLERYLIPCEWQSVDGRSDACATWIQPHQVFPLPTVPFNGADWRPSPEQPDQWNIFPQPDGAVRLVLNTHTPASGFASIFCPVPVDVQLKPDDLLRAEIRVFSTGNDYFRVNLLTTAKEAFSHSDDASVSEQWTRIAWRIGDFGPTLWSHIRPKYQTPFDQLKFLRISFQGLNIGDSVEIRNAGVMR